MLSGLPENRSICTGIQIGYLKIFYKSWYLLMCNRRGFQGIHGDAPSPRSLQSASTPEPIAGQEAGQWISAHTELNPSRTSQTTRQYGAAAVPCAAASTAHDCHPRNSGACWQCHAFSTLLFPADPSRSSSSSHPPPWNPNPVVLQHYSVPNEKKSSAISEIHTQPLPAPHEMWSRSSDSAISRSKALQNYEFE